MSTNNELFDYISDLTGIPSSGLFHFSPPNSRTVFISDGGSILIKWLKNSAPYERQGLEYAIESGVNTPRLLNHGSFAGHDILVLEYMSGEFSHLPNPLPALETVWSNEGKDSFARMTPDSLYERFVFNLGVAGVKHTVWDAKDLVNESNYLIGESEPRQTWIHGDAHEGNIILVDGVPTIIDWEWHSVGVRELDVARWLQSHAIENSEPDVTEFWSALKDTDLDLDLVLVLSRLWALVSLSTFTRTRSHLELIEPASKFALGESDVIASLMYDIKK